jgi:hypothetical protein
MSCLLYPSSLKVFMYQHCIRCWFVEWEWLVQPSSVLNDAKIVNECKSLYLWVNCVQYIPAIYLIFCSPRPIMHCSVKLPKWTWMLGWMLLEYWWKSRSFSFLFVQHVYHLYIYISISASWPPSSEGLDLLMEVLCKHLLCVLCWYFSKQWDHAITRQNVCFLKTNLEGFFWKRHQLFWCGVLIAELMDKPDLSDNLSVHTWASQFNLLNAMSCVDLL